MAPPRRVFVLLPLLLSAACGTTVPSAGSAAGDFRGGPGLAQPPSSDGSGARTVPSSGVPSATAGGRQPGGTSGTTSQPLPGGNLPPPAVGGAARGGPAPGTSGRGYDARHIYIGVTTANDTKAAAEAAGYEGVDPGDVETNVRAVLAELNRKGGLFGRELTPRFHDESQATITYNPSQAAQSSCFALTQDTPVALVVNTLPGIDGAPFYSCLARAQTPFVTTAPRLTDDAFQQEFAPYFHSTIQPSWDRVVPVLLARLQAQGFFQKWDNAEGAPGSAPVKVGLLYGNATVNSRVFHRLADQLVRRGYSKPTAYEYDMSAFASVGGGVLTFKSAGVTHVIVDEAVLSVFAQAAEQQGYRPRYAMQTIMQPAGAAGFMPARQLTGVLGIGWAPIADVDTQPPQSAAQRHCNDLLRAAGKSYAGNPTAQMNAFGTCDALLLAVPAFARAASLQPTAFRQGFLAERAAFASASTFGGGPTSPSVAGSVRDFGYLSTCSCLRYLSDRNYPL